VRANCRGCKIIAADVIDEVNMEGWLRVFKKTAKKPRIWGLHNYRDTNKRKGQRLGGTKRLLKAVKGEIWLTETGGIVKFGRSFPRDEHRAARAVAYALKLARDNERVQRVYLYNWTGAKPSDRFDAGFIAPDGTARPAYDVLRAAVGK
jgi:hypothetical protein